MRSFTLSATLATIVLAAMGSMSQASPMPLEEYIPLSKRTFTPEQYAKHDALHKRSSAGYNDWGCKVTKVHPRPIVFVHGLGSNGLENWQYMGPRFALKGYCTFTITYGQYKNIPLLAGLDKMENSAVELATFVNQVLASTNATKVNLVGHSEGSMMPRYWLKFLGGASKVDKYAAIGGIVHGTTLYGLVPFLTGLVLYDPIKSVVDPLCLSCFEVLVNSPFLQNLNSPSDTVPGVLYHFISSKDDELVTPYTNGFLFDAARNPLAHNVVLQDLCALDISGHIAQMADPIAFHSIAAFFDPNEDQTTNCLDALH